MKRTVRKIKKIVCCLLVGLLLSEQITAAVHAEENGQQNVEEDAGNGTVSGNDAVPDSVSDAENTANKGLTAVPYAEESRANDVGDVYDFAVDNLRYKISDTDPTQVTCVRYVTDPKGAVVIPEKVENGGTSYTVCGIGDKAFYYCDNMTSIQLPDTITTIGESAFENCYALETVNIPSSATSIGSKAFKLCFGLKCDIIIPEGVTEIQPETFRSCYMTGITLPNRLEKIGTMAFEGCVHLESISIPESVTDIGEHAFAACNRLKSINIPKGITTIRQGTFAQCGFESFDIPEHITIMEDNVFVGCRQLEKVSIPGSVTSLTGTFTDCVNLKSIEIPSTILQISQLTFLDCSNLTELKMWDTTKIGYAPVFQGCQKFATFKIVITSDKPQPLTINKPETSFEGCPADRRLVFLNEDGTELTGDALAAAQNAYRAVNDGDTTDDLWYGWKIGDTPEAAYAVEIKVNLDDKPWADSGKTFCLSKDGGNSYITDLRAVVNGTYDIYEVTGTADGTRAAGYLDTRVDVAVDGGDAEATVDYYTVTFYDADIPYGEDTQQHPQIVLKGGKAARPEADPGKAGFSFKGWMTAKDGNTLFDFDNTAIAETTGIYAGWVDSSVTLYQITATASGGGHISPDGTVKVNKGADQTFNITPQEGYEIQEVLVDGKSQGAVESYTFINVTGNHTISVSFLKKEETGGNSGTEKPGENEDGTGGTEKPGENEGGNSGTEKPGGNEGGNSGTEKPGGNEGGTGGTEKPGENAGGTDGTEKPGGNAAGTEETNQPEGNESDRGAEESGNAGSTGSTDAAVNHGAGGPGEPKTGDVSRVEVYATAAMIAGLLYLLSYFVESKGMTEAEKKEIISSIISWASEGRKYRRYVAFAAIFFVLVYYHSIGKSTTVEAKSVLNI